jgi:glutathione synthase/RimK-type ligase-like ATP-grasp enzyme
MKTIGLVNVRQYNKSYQRIIKELGHKSILFDIYSDDLPATIKKMDKKVDVYYWQSIDRGHFYRAKILDPVYYIEKYSPHKIFPDFNQVFTFNDKMKQYQIFQHFNIPTPRTFITTDNKKALQYISRAKYPFVLKDPHSSSGLAVYLIKTKKQAKEILNKIFSPKGHNSLFSKFYAQDFIPNLDKSLRVIVIGEKTYCAYWRISPDDWKHHVGPGATVSDKNIPRSATRLCEGVSQKLGFHWMAYDILMRAGKPQMIEFSPNFGITGARQLGYHPRREIIKYTIKHA